MGKPALIALLMATLSLSLAALPLVYADFQANCAGCRHTIKVIPVDSTETGDPIVTSTPARLMIYHTGNGPIKNVWLLIVLNTQTYSALGNILIDGETFMTKTDFALVSEKKIPLLTPNSSTTYPGSLCQYEVSAIKDKMSEKGMPIYFGVMFLTDEITRDPTYFELDLQFDSSVSNTKALVLALGRYDNFVREAVADCHRFEPFNACTSFSKSTLVVPEVATMVLSAAPFGALGFLYTIKRRKK